MKRRLFMIAHSIKQNYTSFAEALKVAWKTLKLMIELKKSVVSFSFKKIDGSIRNAVGTLKDVPATNGTKAKNYSILTFFDVEIQQWRSAQIQNIKF